MTKNDLSKRLEELTTECRASDDTDVRLAGSVLGVLNGALEYNDTTGLAVEVARFATGRIRLVRSMIERSEQAQEAVQGNLD